MKLRFFALYCIPFAISNLCNSQTILNADAKKDTYAHINSVLAPGYNAIEVPDLSHPEFGPHITTIFDADLNKDVFKFTLHVTPDNDVSTTKTDRQRIEIKTYGSSPEHLKGTVGETIEYKWRFKLPVGFQPTSSFTHIHQIKAVGGDESNPIFTLTPRKGTPNKMELIYVESETSGTDKKVIVNLSLFEGVWVEVTETLKIGPQETYSITIKKVNDSSVLLSYTSNDIATIRPDNSFIRPKWGIYRSLNSSSELRDESLLFSDFSITELTTLEIKDQTINPERINSFPNPVTSTINFTANTLNTYTNYTILDATGKVIDSKKLTSTSILVDFLNSGMYFVKLSGNDFEQKTIKFIKQ